MPMQKQIVPVPFAGGLDTKTDPKQVIAGKLLGLQNGIFSQTGLISRRWGYTALATAILGGGNIASAQAIAAFGNELHLYDGQKAYSYIASENEWSSKGTMVPCSQSNKPIIAGNYQQLSPDHASIGGIDVYAWEDSRGGIRYSVFDSTSGTSVFADQQVTSVGARPKVVPFPNQNLVGIFFDSTGGSIGFCTVSPSTPTVLTFRNSIGAALPVTEYYDVAVAPNGNIYIVYYKVIGGVNTVQASLIAPALSSLTWTTTVFTAAGATVPTGCIGAVVDSSNNLWAMYASVATTSVSAATLNSSGAIVNASALLLNNSPIPFVAIGGVVTSISGQLTLTAFFEQDVTGPQKSYSHALYYRTLSLGGTLGTLTQTSVGLGLASKPFVFGGNIFLNVAFATEQQATYFLITQGGQVVSKTQYGLGGGYINNSDYILPECQQIATGIFEYANLVKGTPNTEAGVVLSLLGVNATTVNLNPDSFQHAAIGGELYTVGGLVHRYDGTLYVETGFNVYPEEVNLTPLTTGGLIAAGTYGYAVTYEYEDNLGNNEISTPSVVQFVTTTTATSSVSVLIPVLYLTNKVGVKLVVYRTTNNGTLLYRVTSAAVPTYNTYPASLTNPLVNFVDTLADASIQSNGLMYTQPLSTGEDPVLPNFSPPACQVIATYANRLWIAGTDSPNTLYYSQTTILGSPAQFCSALNLMLDPDGGAITAIMRMDGNLIVFKQRAIFYVTGQGPTATGDQSDLGSPIQIPTGGVGCSNANAMVLTPMGLLFQSGNGIYLLDRSLNCSYKGAPVEAFNSLAITSATLIPNQWVVFTAASGTALVYDYFYDQWSTFTNHAAVDADIFVGDSGLFVYANPNGTVFVQTPGAFSDNGSPIPFSLTTAWLNPTAIQGYQRIYHAYLLGQWISAHTMNITAQFDYDASRSVSATIPVLTAPANPAVYQYRLDVLTKCQAFQIVVTDSQSGSGGAGFSLSAISLVVGVKQGGNKLPAIKQFGVT